MLIKNSMTLKTYELKLFEQSIVQHHRSVFIIKKQYEP